MDDWNEKEILEIEKLKEEIKSLKVSPWAKPTILFPILIPLFAVVISFYVNKDYINLQLEVKALKLEQESIKLEDRKRTLGAEIENLTKKLQATEKIAEHRLSFIMKTEQLARLDFATSSASGVFSGYRLYLETNNREFFVNYKRLYKDEIDRAFFTNYDPYDIDDDLKRIEQQFVTEWQRVRVSLNDFEKKITNNEYIDREKYAVIFLEEQTSLNSIQKLSGCYIKYDDLSLICPE